MIDKNDWCIATISWARTSEEEAVLAAALQHLAAYEVPVFITDGGSTASFLHFIKSIPHFTLLHTSLKGVLAQAKTSLAAAYKTGAPFIVYTEPDKEAFFKNGLRKLVASGTNNKAGIVLAARSERGFQSFPAFQQSTEAAINKCCTEVMGLDVDFTYGPFLLTNKLVKYVDELQEDIGWGWRPYLFSMAHRLGLPIEAVVDDFMCPEGQQNDSKKERIYRMKQLEQNIRGLVLSTEASL